MKEEIKKYVKLGVLGVIAVAIIVIIYGFLSGGLVLGSTLVMNSEAMADKEIVNRLGPICVSQFNLDSEKSDKSIELRKSFS